MSTLKTNRTAKYRMVKGHFCKLALVFERALSTTASHLFQAELITSAANEQAHNTNQPVSDRSYALMNEILKMIELDHKWYDVFLSVMRNLDQTGIDMADELNTALQKEGPFMQQCPLALGHGCSHCCGADTPLDHSPVHPEMDSGVAEDMSVSTLHAGDEMELPAPVNNVKTHLLTDAEEQGDNTTHSPTDNQGDDEPYGDSAMGGLPIVHSQTTQPDGDKTQEVSDMCSSCTETAHVSTQMPNSMVVCGNSPSIPVNAMSMPPCGPQDDQDLDMTIEEWTEETTHPHTYSDNLTPPISAPYIRLTSATLHSDNWNLKAENTYLDSQNKSQESEIDKFKATIEILKVEHSKDSAWLKEQVDKKESEVAQLKEHVDKKESEVAQLEEQVDKKESKVAKLETLCEEKDRFIEDLKKSKAEQEKIIEKNCDQVQTDGDLKNRLMLTEAKLDHEIKMAKLREELTIKLSIKSEQYLGCANAVFVAVIVMLIVAVVVVATHRPSHC